MYKLISALRRFFSLDNATSIRPQDTCAMNLRQLADLPPHHPRCD